MQYKIIDRSHRSVRRVCPAVEPHLAGFDRMAGSSPSTYSVAAARSLTTDDNLKIILLKSYLKISEL